MEIFSLINRGLGTKHLPLSSSNVKIMNAKGFLQAYILRVEVEATMFEFFKLGARENEFFLCVKRFDCEA